MRNGFFISAPSIHFPWQVFREILPPILRLVNEFEESSEARATVEVMLAVPRIPACALLLVGPAHSEFVLLKFTHGVGFTLQRIFERERLVAAIKMKAVRRKADGRTMPLEPRFLERPTDQRDLACILAGDLLKPADAEQQVLKRIS